MSNRSAGAPPPEASRQKAPEASGDDRIAPALDEEGSEIAARVASQIEELIDKDPPKEEIRRLAAQIVRTTEVYAGVMPHPAHFKAYDNVVPGAAERILAMAEREQEAQIAATKANISIAMNAQASEASLRRLGLFFGFAALLVLLGSAFAAAVFISIEFGFAILAIGVAGIVGKFVVEHFRGEI